MFFARLCDVFLRGHNIVIYLLNIVTFFDNVRITLYFGTFELRKEITLRLRFVFARHCDVFSLHQNYVIYLFAVVTFFDGDRITLHFSSSNYVLKLRYKTVIFLSHLFVTKK